MAFSQILTNLSRIKTIRRTINMKLIKNFSLLKVIVRNSEALIIYYL